MESEPSFTRVEPELLPVLEELHRREPIFHRQEFGRTVADFDRAMAAEYWEVGASGRRYSREFILRTLTNHPPVDAVAAGWKCSEFGLRRLGPECYLVTYTLDQSGRVTRRATLWERTENGWRILYHQGTMVATADERESLSRA